MSERDQVQAWCDLFQQKLDRAFENSDLSQITQLVAEFDGQLEGLDLPLDVSSVETLCDIQRRLETLVDTLRSEVMGELRGLQRGRAGQAAYARASQL